MEVQVKVAKETYELGQGLSGAIGKIKKALEDGFQPGQDITPIVSAVVTDLVPVVDNVMKIQGEYDGDKKEFLNGVVLGVSGIASHFIK